MTDEEEFSQFQCEGCSCIWRATYSCEDFSGTLVECPLCGGELIEEKKPTSSVASKKFPDEMEAFVKDHAEDEITYLELAELVEDEFDIKLTDQTMRDYCRRRGIKKAPVIKEKAVIVIEEEVEVINTEEDFARAEAKERGEEYVPPIKSGRPRKYTEEIIEFIREKVNVDKMKYPAIARAVSIEFSINADPAAIGSVVGTYNLRDTPYNSNNKPKKKFDPETFSYMEEQKKLLRRYCKKYGAKAVRYIKTHFDEDLEVLKRTVLETYRAKIENSEIVKIINDLQIKPDISLKRTSRDVF